MRPKKSEVNSQAGCISSGDFPQLPSLSGTQSTELLEACDKGNFVAAKQTLENAASQISSTQLPERTNVSDPIPLFSSCRDRYMRTAMHLACNNGNTEIALFLLAYFPQDLNARNEFECTPLHGACARGKADTALALIEKGSDVRAVNKGLDTPMHLACRYI